MKKLINNLTVIDNSTCLRELSEKENADIEHYLRAQEIENNINTSREKIEFTTDVREALNNRLKVYSPLEETTKSIKSMSSGISNIGGFILYLDGVAKAFERDTTTFDKISAVGLIIPYIGPLLGIADAISKDDWVSAIEQTGILVALGIVPELEPVVIIVALGVEAYNEVENFEQVQQGLEDYIKERNRCWDIICNQGLVYWHNYINEPIKERILQSSDALRSQVRAIEATFNYETLKLLNSREFTQVEREQIINTYHEKMSYVYASANESIEKIKISLFHNSIELFKSNILPVIKETMKKQNEHIVEQAKKFVHQHEGSIFFPVFDLLSELLLKYTEKILKDDLTFDFGMLPTEDSLINEELVNLKPFRLSDDKHLLNISYTGEAYQDTSGNSFPITLMGNVEKHYGKDEDMEDSSYFNNTKIHHPIIRLQNIIDEKMDKGNLAKWSVNDNEGFIGFNDENQFYMHNNTRLSREITLDPNTKYKISFSSYVDNYHSPLKFNITDNSSRRIIVTSIITNKSYVDTDIEFITLSSSSYTLEFIKSPDKEIVNEGNAKAWIQHIKIDKHFMDTNNGYISVSGDTHIGSESNFTVAFWLKHINITSDETILTSNMNWESGSPGWGIAYKGNEIIIKISDIHNGVTTFSFIDNEFFNIFINEWNHIAVTFCLGSVIKLYINGLLIKEFNIRNYKNIDSRHEVVIGGDGTKSVLNKTNFAIQNFIIVKEELNNFDILMLYTENSTRNLNFQREVTYNQLETLISEKRLEPGIQYLLGNYKTKYLQPVSEVIKESDYVERLILTATSSDTLSPIASSLDFPDDIIYYDFKNNICEDNITRRYGFIIRRIYTPSGIDMSFDWRTMLWARFKGTAPAWDGGEVKKGKIRQVANNLYLVTRTGQPSSVTDSKYFQLLCSTDDYYFTSNYLIPDTFTQTDIKLNVQDYAERYTFNASSNLRLKEPTQSRQIMPINIVVKTQPGSLEDTMGESIISNNVFMFDNDDDKPKNITLGYYCFNNTFGSKCHDITFGYYCINNFLSHDCHSNLFESHCSHNIFKDGCHSNKLGSYCSSNYFKYNSYSNTLETRCYYNTLGTYSCYNKFTADCSDNVLGSNFSSNNILSPSSDNFIGDMFSNNIIKSCNNLDLTKSIDLYNKKYTITILKAEDSHVAHYYQSWSDQYPSRIKLPQY